jgi:hypothetical protein
MLLPELGPALQAIADRYGLMVQRMEDCDGRGPGHIVSFCNPDDKKDWKAVYGFPGKYGEWNKKDLFYTVPIDKYNVQINVILASIPDSMPEFKDITLPKGCSFIIVPVIINKELVIDHL